MLRFFDLHELTHRCKVSFKSGQPRIDCYHTFGFVIAGLSRAHISVGEGWHSSENAILSLEPLAKVSKEVEPQCYA